MTIYQLWLLLFHQLLASCSANVRMRFCVEMVTYMIITQPFLMIPSSSLLHSSELVPATNCRLIRQVFEKAYSAFVDTHSLCANNSPAQHMHARQLPTGLLEILLANWVVWWIYIFSLQIFVLSELHTNHININGWWKHKKISYQNFSWLAYQSSNSWFGLTKLW